MELLWTEAPKSGCCPTCGSSVNPRGFVDMISDVDVMREGIGIVGVLDLTLCATCLEQASRMVGCASRDEVYAMAERELELLNELEKVKDEVQSERQKHEQFVENLYAFAGDSTSSKIVSE